MTLFSDAKDLGGIPMGSSPTGKPNNLHRPTWHKKKLRLLTNSSLYPQNDKDIHAVTSGFTVYRLDYTMLSYFASLVSS